MTFAWRLDPELPEEIRGGLITLRDGLIGSLGDDLIAVMLYGALAHGDPFQPLVSDVNVLVVLRDTSTPKLNAMAPFVCAAQQEINAQLLVLNEEDLTRSTDVFPVKFSDMRSHHQCLYGPDVLADVEVARDHLRLRCEQLFKDLGTKLRRLYLLNTQRPERLEWTLVRATTAFIGALAGLLKLIHGQAPATRLDVAMAASDAFGLDRDALRALVSLRFGEDELSSEALGTLYQRLMDETERAATIADRYEVDQAPTLPPDPTER